MQIKGPIQKSIAGSPDVQSGTLIGGVSPVLRIWM
jgi:hypothetical protein